MSLRSCCLVYTLPLVLLVSISPAQSETPEEIAAITNAAERGNQGAQLLLGLMFREGRGVRAMRASVLFDRRIGS